MLQIQLSNSASSQDSISSRALNILFSNRLKGSSTQRFDIRSKLQGKQMVNANQCWSTRCYRSYLNYWSVDLNSTHLHKPTYVLAKPGSLDANDTQYSLIKTWITLARVKHGQSDLDYFCCSCIFNMEIKWVTNNRQPMGNETFGLIKAPKAWEKGKLEKSHKFLCFYQRVRPVNLVLDISFIPLLLFFLSSFLTSLHHHVLNKILIRHTMSLA